MGKSDRLPGIRTGRLLLVIACAAVALAACRALQREEGDPLFGFVVVAACVASLAAVAMSRERDRRRRLAGSRGANLLWWVPLRSLLVTVILIGLPDVTFVAAYWCCCGGRWYVVPYLHGPRVLNANAVMAGAGVALVVALLLRCALWSSGLCRSTRLASLSVAVSIVALLLAGAGIILRRAEDLARAR